MATLRRGFKTWCENTARGYRRSLGLDWYAPLPPRLLAKYLEVIVWSPNEVPNLPKEHLEHLTVVDPDSWDAVTLQLEGRNLVILNEKMDIGRMNNSLAHELSHIILKHEPAQVFVDPQSHMHLSHYNPVHEDEANCLSGSLLVPRDAILHVLEGGMDDGGAAAHFGVSLQLFTMRKNLTGVARQLGSRGYYRA